MLVSKRAASWGAAQCFVGKCGWTPTLLGTSLLFVPDEQVISTGDGRMLLVNTRKRRPE